MSRTIKPVQGPSACTEVAHVRKRHVWRHEDLEDRLFSSAQELPHLFFSRTRLGAFPRLKAPPSKAIEEPKSASGHLSRPCGSFTLASPRTCFPVGVGPSQGLPRQHTESTAQGICVLVYRVADSEIYLTQTTTGITQDFPTQFQKSTV